MSLSSDLSAYHRRLDAANGPSHFHRQDILPLLAASPDFQSHIAALQGLSSRRLTVQQMQAQRERHALRALGAATRDALVPMAASTAAGTECVRWQHNGPFDVAKKFVDLMGESQEFI